MYTGVMIKIPFFHLLSRAGVEGGSDGGRVFLPGLVMPDYSIR